MKVGDNGDSNAGSDNDDVVVVVDGHSAVVATPSFHVLNDLALDMKILITVACHKHHTH